MREPINTEGPRGQSTCGSISARAGTHPDAIALLAPGRALLTYHGLWHQVMEVTGALNEMGVGRNDRVDVVMPDGPEAVVAFMEVTSTATSMPLNSASRRREFDFYLSNFDVKTLLHSGRDGLGRMGCGEGT